MSQYLCVSIPTRKMTHFPERVLIVMALPRASNVRKSSKNQENGKHGIRSNVLIFQFWTLRLWPVNGDQYLNFEDLRQTMMALNPAWFSFCVAFPPCGSWDDGKPFDFTAKFGYKEKKSAFSLLGLWLLAMQP